ncbi:MAG: gliding motility-associated C-terminal domain-containing protein [Cryomorphaceae bacterium]|nr:gliding motility-associated C-terminal domain-containing protein [Flavobacteriales bacterium]
MIIRQILYTAFFFGLGFSACAQTTLSRQVIANSGFSEVISGTTEVSYTTGEALVSTETGESTVLTQGFHQPNLFLPLMFDVETTAATCPTSSDGGAFVVNLIGCSSPYSVSWSNGDTGMESPDLMPGLYAVTVNAPGCSLTIDFEILSGPESECELKFFNAFSPNDDGNNDLWEIENIEADVFSNNEVEIYNRWGQLIWEGEGYNNADVVWDGKTQSGMTLAEGTYYYVAVVNNKTHKGYIELTK